MKTNYQNFCIKSFFQIFENKGTVGSVAEKALNNFKSKKKKNESIERLYYFAIGHAFKQIDKKNIFGLDENDEQKDLVYTKFLHLLKPHFERCLENNEKGKPKLLQVIEDIRNQNSHFLHTFDELSLDKIEKETIVPFLKESFELALIQSFLKEKIDSENQNRENRKAPLLSNVEKEEILKKIIEKDGNNELFINFIKRIFFQSLYITKNDQKLNEVQKSEKDFIDKNYQTKDELIDFILLIKVENEFTWELNQKGSGKPDDHIHEMIEIKKRTYLSFEACIFLLSMFLYKNEANQLIPKIRGFKKNKTNEDKSKRNVFTFFAKKFKSQDIDSEESNLVRFRDIIQYLSKYPTEWNAEIEKIKSENPMTTHLKNAIIEMEVSRCFPEMSHDKEFQKFAIQYLFYNEIIESKNKKIYLDIIDKNDEVRKTYYAIKDRKLNFKEYKPNTSKGFTLNYVKQKYFNYKNIRPIDIQKKNIKKFTKELNTNKNVLKLKNRIEHNLLFVSYGRNRDRFMQYAARFLAETNYFGNDAEFKMYQFYTTDEQNAELEKLQENLSKKEFEKLKFHQGKLTHFSTYSKHLKNFPEWDMPFVVQNNAIHVKIKDIPKTVCIQRNLMIYFLEDALFKKSEGKIQFGGYKLIGYYNQLKEEKQSILGNLKNNTPDDEDDEQKAEYKKLFPRKLIQNYFPAEQNNLPEKNSFQLLLDEAIQSEQRYKELKEKAKLERNLEFFENKNKGKNFKLKFIRKACHLMYFRNAYLDQKEEQLALEIRNGESFDGKNHEHEKAHHKRFHITRDEYKDFSKWMFAMDSVSFYKEHLNQLFEDKGFFRNPEFKQLFKDVDSLDKMYFRTKEKFKEWLKTHSPETEKNNKYNLESYQSYLENSVFYINVSHYKKYLEDKKLIETENGRYIYKSLENKNHLIESYYYKPHFDIPKDNAHHREYYKLNHRLRTAKHEDCLLYEMAIFYLKADKVKAGELKNNITEILQQKINFPVEDVKETKYEIEVPFKEIEKFLQILFFNQLQKNSYSIIKNLPGYLEKTKNEDDIKEIFNHFNEYNLLKLDDLNKVHNHLINQQSKFTPCVMAMEEYFIWRHKQNLKELNRLPIGSIEGLKDYFTGDDQPLRGNAFHFNLPNKSYKKFFEQLEDKFIREEFPKEKIENFEDLKLPLQKIFQVFLDQMRNDEDKNDPKVKKKKAQAKYLKTIHQKKKNQ